MQFQGKILLKIKLFFSTFLTFKFLLGSLDLENPNFVDSGTRLDEVASMKMP